MAAQTVLLEGCVKGCKCLYLLAWTSPTKTRSFHQITWQWPLWKKKNHVTALWLPPIMNNLDGWNYHPHPEIYISWCILFERFPLFNRTSECWVCGVPVDRGGGGGALWPHGAAPWPLPEPPAGLQPPPNRCGLPPWHSTEVSGSLNSSDWAWRSFLVVLCEISVFNLIKWILNYTFSPSA